MFQNFQELKLSFRLSEYNLKKIYLYQNLLIYIKYPSPHNLNNYFTNDFKHG